MDKPRFEIGFYYPNPLLTEIANQAGRHLTEKASLGGNLLVAPRNTLVLNPYDIQSGSLQINSLDPTFKVFFLKCTPEEQSKTNQLLKAGITQVIRYDGNLSLDNGDFYLFGNTNPGAINLSLVKLCDPAPTPHFGTFDILEQVAQIAATLHSLNLRHNNFTISNFVLTADNSLPPLVMYNNSRLTSANEKNNSHDLKTFMDSLERTYPECPHGKHKDFIAQKFRQFLLAK